MGIIELLLVAVALGTDAFSLAIGIGMRGISNGGSGVCLEPSSCFTFSCP